MPTAILDLEFHQLPAFTGVPDVYRQARVLVRVGGLPSAWVRVPVEAGGVTAAAVLDAVRAQAGPVFWHNLAREQLVKTQEPDGALPTATVAVCTRDRPDDLRRCLESLSLLPDGDVEILVVDSASRAPETREVVKSFPRARYLRLERPGLNVARNAALQAAAGEIVVFIDDDAVADAGWLRAHRRSFVHPLTLVSTGITLPLELETPAQEAFEAFTSFNRGFAPTVFSRRNLHPLAAGRAGAGVNMALRRDITASVGLFDEALDAGTPTHSGGETELFSRVIAAGYRIAYTPAALNWHRHRRSEEELRRTVYGYGVGVYAFWFSRLFSAAELAATLMAAIWFWYNQLPALLRSLLRRPGAPPWPLPLDELRGCLAGPWAYLRARRAARKAAA